MTNGRTKGRAFEQFFVNVLKALGYEAARASYVNKYLDDVGKVDIVTDAAFNFQLKATEQAPQFHKILKEMDRTKPRVVIWKRNRKPVLLVIELDDIV